MNSTTELRINNLVEYTGDICEVTMVDSLGDLVLYVDGDFFESRITEIEPIHLTEEWLVKFGFEKDNNGEFKNQYKMYVDNFLTIYVHELDYSIELLLLVP